MSSAFRQSNGAIQGQLIHDRIDNNAAKIQFLNQPDMVVMTQAELANYSDDPRFVYYDQTTKDFKQKGGTIRELITGDWTVIKSIETLTNNLEFPDTYNRAKIETDRHFQIPLGDQGGGVPFTIIFNGSDGLLGFETDKDFRHLSNLNEEQQRGIKNRGSNNKIDWNNIQIFSGFPQQFFSPVVIKNPYMLPENGSWHNGLPDPGVNDDENCFKDLWLMWGGIESLEIGPVFNPLDSDLIHWKKVAMDVGSSRFIRPITIGIASTEPNAHSRAHPDHLGAKSIISTYTSTGTNEISGISDLDIKKVRIGARVFDSGGSIPTYPANQKSTIINKIVRNNIDDNSIFLIDSELRSAVTISASGDLTVDFGGNSGLSTQSSTNLSHYHSEILQYCTSNIDGTTELYVHSGHTISDASYNRAGFTPVEGRQYCSTSWGYRNKMRTSNTGSNESRPDNQQRFSYWKM